MKLTPAILLYTYVINDMAGVTATHTQTRDLNIDVIDVSTASESGFYRTRYRLIHLYQI